MDHTDREGERNEFKDRAQHKEMKMDIHKIWTKTFKIMFNAQNRKHNRILSKQRRSNSRKRKIHATIHRVCVAKVNKIVQK